MEYNLQKTWTTMLYTWNLHDIINQLYFNGKKKEFISFLATDDWPREPSRIS